MRVLKYTLNGKIEEVEMPVGAKVLHVDSQGGLIQVWAEVDDIVYDTEIRFFDGFATGESFEVDEDDGCFTREFVGTVLMADIGFMKRGELVFHVYERVFK